MIKKTLCLIAVTAFILTSSCKNENREAVMKFDEPEYDFGEINATEKVEHVFTFTNTGNIPLVINEAKGSCGCTVPEYPKTPVAPGEKADVKVSFNPTGKRGKQSKTVTFMVNTQKGSELITIKAMIKAEPENNSSPKKHV